MSTRRIIVAHSPDSDDAFMFYGLASGAVAAEGFEIDHALADIETLNRAAFDGQYRGERRLLPCLRAFHRSLSPAAARREHGRRLWTHRGDPGRRSHIARRRPRGHPRKADDGLAGASALRPVGSVRHDAVRRHTGGSVRWSSRGRPDHSRRPAHLRRRWTPQARGPR